MNLDGTWMAPRECERICKSTSMKFSLYHISKSLLRRTKGTYNDIWRVICCWLNFPNVPLSSGHRVIDITNGHFIHAGPLEGTGVSIYLCRILRWSYVITHVVLHYFINLATSISTSLHSIAMSSINEWLWKHLNIWQRFGVNIPLWHVLQFMHVQKNSTNLHRNFMSSHIMQAQNQIVYFKHSINTKE